ncbi:unnamed protein product, partial [Ectocarpus sp. 12 AP-2014]
MPFAKAKKKDTVGWVKAATEIEGGQDQQAPFSSNGISASGGSQFSSNSTSERT